MKPEFKIGDEVVATKKITRQDWRCVLNVGERAVIRGASKGTRDGVWVVDITLSDGNLMRDIVVENGIPLKKA